MAAFLGGLCRSSQITQYSTAYTIGKLVGDHLSEKLHSPTKVCYQRCLCLATLHKPQANCK